MKKFIVVFLIIVALIAGLRYIFYPRKYNMTLQGIKYKLGKENMNYSEPATIEIEGTLARDMKGGRTFQGRINVVGEKIETHRDNRDITIYYDNNNHGFMQYIYYGDTGPSTRIFTDNFGQIYTNDDFTKFTICVYDKKGLNSSGWNSSSGTMITFPVGNREEALKMSNELMSKSLKGLNVKPLE